MKRLMILMLLGFNSIYGKQLFSDYFTPIFFMVLRLNYKTNFKEEIRKLSMEDFEFNETCMKQREVESLERRYDTVFYVTFALAASWYALLRSNEAVESNGYFSPGDVWSYNVHYFLYYCSLATLATKYMHLFYYQAQESQGINLTKDYKNE